MANEVRLRSSQGILKTDSRDHFSGTESNQKYTKNPTPTQVTTNTETAASQCLNVDEEKARVLKRYGARSEKELIMYVNSIQYGGGCTEMGIASKEDIVWELRRNGFPV